MRNLLTIFNHDPCLWQTAFLWYVSKFPLSLPFKNLVIISLSVGLLGSTYLEFTELLECLYRCLSSNLGDLKNILSGPFSFLSPSRTPTMGTLSSLAPKPLKAPHRSLKLCIFLFNLFFPVPQPQDFPLLYLQVHWYFLLPAHILPLKLSSKCVFQLLYFSSQNIFLLYFYCPVVLKSLANKSTIRSLLGTVSVGLLFFFEWAIPLHFFVCFVIFLLKSSHFNLIMWQFWRSRFCLHPQEFAIVFFFQNKFL